MRGGGEEGGNKSNDRKRALSSLRIQMKTSRTEGRKLPKNEKGVKKKALAKKSAVTALGGTSNGKIFRDKGKRKKSRSSP